MKYSVTIDFREFCLAKYPVLRGSKRLRALFRYLCFASFHDGDTLQLVAPFRVLHQEIAPDERERDFNATALLEELRDKALPLLAWTDWSRTGRGWHGRARRILHDGFDAETRERRDAELTLRSDAAPFVGMVDFDTGERFRSYRRDRITPAAWADHRAALEVAAMNPTQRKIVDYLDGLDGSRLLLPRFALNRGPIEEEIAKLPEHVAHMQRRILAAVQEQPQVFYRPSAEGRTCRLNACGDTVIGLKSEVRKAFCSGWSECDLRASQFAILASVLDAPICKALIARGENLWRSLYLHTHQVEGNPPKAIKAIFKEVVYSVAFGKSAANLARFLRPHGLERLLDHPVLQELLQLRAQWFERMENAGGAADVWGTWHAIRRGTECGPGERPRLARHIAATVIQSIELEIIAPIFDVARTHGDTYQFGIVLFQHDGATISFRARGKRKEKAMTLLRDAVETRARDLGVQTTLEFADLEATAAPVAPSREEVVETRVGELGVHTALGLDEPGALEVPSVDAEQNGNEVDLASVGLDRNATVDQLVAELERDLRAGGHIIDPEPCHGCGMPDTSFFEGEIIVGWCCDACWDVAEEAEENFASERDDEMAAPLMRPPRALGHDQGEVSP